MPKVRTKAHCALARRAGSYRGSGADLLLDLAVALVVGGLLLAALARCGGGDDDRAPRSLADPALTPGTLNPDVTQATIATHDLRARLDATIRPPSSYTSPLKVEADGDVRPRGARRPPTRRIT